MPSLVEQLLKDVPRSPAGRDAPLSKMIRSVRTGVRSSRAQQTFRELDLSVDEASRSIGLSVRTFQRRKAGRQRLDPIESEKVLRLARVADAATETLGTREAARLWLRLPNVALGNQSPLTLLDTDIGASAVLDTLTRLESGVFS